jgi:ferredoxin
MAAQQPLYMTTAKNLQALFGRLREEGELYLPGKTMTGENTEIYPYRRADGKADFSYHGYRPKQPLKTFLFTGRFQVSSYPVSKEPVIPETPLFIAGVTACDLLSLRTLDTIFLEQETTDPFYRANRERTILFSIDCTNPRETCFCTMAGIHPYPVEGFDVNISSIGDSFLLEGGSEKGIRLLEKNRNLFSSPEGDPGEERNRKRREAENRIKRWNEKYALSTDRKTLLEKQRENIDWQRHVSPCVECAACLFACPTCHCFLLYDQPDGRIKSWDACSYAGYSRMAGGSSPRLGIMQRFRHRYLHKFEYFPVNFGFEACTGCGRCIEGCMGRIDMRTVLKELDSTPAGAR